jgi:hypothetical protein
LLGAEPGANGVDQAAKTRYARVAELLANEHLIASPRIRSTLADRQPGASGPTSIWNDHTQYSVLFEPKSRTLRVAFPDKTGTPGKYAAVSLKESAR